MGAEDDAVGFVADVAEGEGVEEVDGVDVGAGRVIGSERVVVPVNDNDRARAENRMHGRGLRRGEADGEEALPVAAGEGAAGAQIFERTGGQMDEFEDGALMGDGRMESSGLGNERNDGDKGRGGLESGARGFRQNVVDAEGLCGEHAIERGEAEASLAVDEIGKMGRTQAGLLSEKSSG